jgi:hypothetical protein
LPPFFRLPGDIECREVTFCRVFLRAAFGIALSLIITQPRAWSFAELLGPPSAEDLRRVDEGWARKTWDVAGTAFESDNLPAGPVGIAATPGKASPKTPWRF